MKRPPSLFFLRLLALGAVALFLAKTVTAYQGLQWSGVLVGLGGAVGSLALFLSPQVFLSPLPSTPTDPVIRAHLSPVSRGLLACGGLCAFIGLLVGAWA